MRAMFLELLSWAVGIVAVMFYLLGQQQTRQERAKPDADRSPGGGPTGAEVHFSDGGSDGGGDGGGD